MQTNKSFKFKRSIILLDVKCNNTVIIIQETLNQDKTN